MESRNYRVYSHSILSCLLVGLVLVLLNVAFSRASVRADMTEEGIFSLEDGSRAILGKLKDPVAMTVFWGNIPKGAREKRRYFEGILEEIAAHSQGKVSVVWVDADTEEGEAQAAKMNVPKLQVRAVEGSSVVLQDAYAGLVVESGDQPPTVVPNIIGLDRGLEYRLMADLDSRAELSPPVIGFYDADDPEIRMRNMSGRRGGRPGRFTIAMQGLSEIAGRSLRVLETLGERVDPEVEVLIVAAPHTGTINEQAVFALDQFVMRGGRLMIALDPVNFFNAGKKEGEREPRTSGLEGWLEHLGVTAEYGVVGDFSRRNKGTYQTAEGLGPYPFLPLVQGEGLSQDHILTRGDQLVIPFAWPAALSVDEAKQEDAGRTVIRLLQTSPDGYRRPEIGIVAETLRFPTPDIAERGQYTLGLWMEGPATSYFKGKLSPAEQLAEAARKAKEAADAAAALENPDETGEGHGEPAPPGATGTPDGSPPTPPAGDAPGDGETPPDEPGDAGGDGPDDEAEDAPAGPPRFDEGTAHVLLLSDAEFFANYFVRGEIARLNRSGGFNFFLGAAGWMRGSEDLLTITAPEGKKRSLEELDASERDWIKLLNLLGVPLLLLCIGVVVFIVRRSQGS